MDANERNAGAPGGYTSAESDAEGAPGSSPEKGTKNETAVGKCGVRCQSGSSDAFVEAVICKESDLEENVMTAQNIPQDGEILMVRQKGKIYAIGNSCPHFGAQLHTGSLGVGTVRCPWHGACFNLATGDIEDFPGLDSLPCLKVTVQSDGGVKVRGFRKHLEKGVRVPCRATVRQVLENDSRTFVVVGGGPAAQVCAETLREDGFQGKLIMLAKENHLPYDRTMISKSMDVTIDEILLRSKKFYKKYDIDLKIGVELLSVDASQKVLDVSSGEKIKYDSLFLATGARARQLPIPGGDLQNVFTLRTIDDTNNVSKEISKAKSMVIIGDSFIGMECASSCLDSIKSISVIGLQSVPFELSLGPKIGGQIMKLFQDQGVKFYMNSKAIEILPKESDSSSAGQVKLESGELLEADFVVTGVGCIFNTEFLEGSGIQTERGAVPVNEYLETCVPGIFAGGDIALAPVLGHKACIGHWQLAHYHGRIAGHNMAGKKVHLNAVPFFWTRLLDFGIRYAGFVFNYDDVVFHGDLETMTFIAYYCQGNSVKAISTSNNDPLASHFAHLLSLGKSLSKDEVQENPTAWVNKIYE